MLSNEDLFSKGQGEQGNGKGFIIFIELPVGVLLLQLYVPFLIAWAQSLLNIHCST